MRVAEEKDYEQITSLLRQLNPDDSPFGQLEREVFEEVLASEGLYLIVAEEETKVVASCYLNIIPNLTRGGRPYAVIENVITDRAWRNRAFGKAVVDHAVSLACKAGCYKVMLLSGRKDEAVHSFYNKCGFDGSEKQAYIMRISNL